MLIVTAENNNLKIVNIDNNGFEPYNINAQVTVAKWHPRHASKILVGTRLGQIKIFDLEKRQFEFEYKATYDESKEK